MEIKDRDGNVFTGTPEELKSYFGKVKSKNITTTVYESKPGAPNFRKFLPEIYDGKLQADFIPLEKRSGNKAGSKRGPYNKKGSRKNQRWTREEDLKVIGVFNNKANRFANGTFKRSVLLSFASKLGRTKKSVYLRFRKLGLDLKK